MEFNSDPETLQHVQSWKDLITTQVQIEIEISIDIEIMIEIGLEIEIKIEIEPTIVIEMNDRGRDRSNEGGRGGGERSGRAQEKQEPHTLDVGKKIWSKKNLKTENLGKKE